MHSLIRRMRNIYPKNTLFLVRFATREDDLREIFPIPAWVSSNDNLLKSIFNFQYIAELF